MKCSVAIHVCSHSAEKLSKQMDPTTFLKDLQKKVKTTERSSEVSVHTTPTAELDPPHTVHRATALAVTTAKVDPPHTVHRATALAVTTAKLYRPTSHSAQSHSSSRSRCSLLQELADKYLSGKPVDDFVEEFMRLRSQYWLRKVKAEKMDELIRSQHPSPRSRPKRPPNPVIRPPYVSPMPVPHPAHSLPPSQARSPGRSPAQSLPPYAHQPMPQPPVNHPFPAAAFTPYQPPRPPQQPAHPGYYPHAPPPKPGGPYGFRT